MSAVEAYRRHFAGPVELQVAGFGCRLGFSFLGVGRDVQDETRGSRTHHNHGFHPRRAIQRKVKRQAAAHRTADQDQRLVQVKGAEQGGQVCQMAELAFNGPTFAVTAAVVAQHAVILGEIF